MIDDEQEAITAQPVGIDHASVRYGMHLAAVARGNQHAAFARTFFAGAKSRDDSAAQRPRQAAMQLGEGFRAGDLLGNVGEHIAQFFQQFEQAFLVLAQRRKPAMLILQRGFEFGQYLATLLVLGLELLRLRGTLIARGLEFRGFALDRDLHLCQRIQILEQAVDLAQARVLEIAVIRQHAADGIDAILRQQQFQFLATAHRVGRTQQRRQRVALILELGIERITLVHE